MFSPEMVITMACWPNKDYACMLSALAIALVTSAVIKSMPTGDAGGGFVHSGSMIGLRRQRAKRMGQGWQSGRDGNGNGDEDKDNRHSLRSRDRVGS